MKHQYLLKAFLCVLISVFIMLLLELSIFEMFNRTIHFSFLVCVIIILIFWLLSIRFFYKFSLTVHEEKTARETDRLQLEESQKLIQSLQSQRHDYRNQLQVIRMLAQLNKTQELIKYVDDYTSSADNSASLSTQINNSTISALFLVYQIEAKDKGIKLNVDSDLDFAEFPYSPAKITRILGNIIRNAIEILEKITLPQREIQVTLWKTVENYLITIWNNGSFIPQENIDKIFSTGFSTKNSSGLGLSIVKELIDEFGGQIEVHSSSERGTEFKISLPFKKSVAI